MTTTPNVADDLAHAHLQMASGAFLKVFDLLRGSKASMADPASADQAVIFTDELTWVVDSLNVQHVLLQMLPAGQRDSVQAVRTLGTILRCASNLERVDASVHCDLEQEKVDGDVLVNVLNALTGLAFGPLGQPRLKRSRDSSGRHSKEDHGGFAARNSLYEVLQLIEQSVLFNKAVAGAVSLGPLASATDLMQEARIDFGAFAALYGLTPFVFTSSTPDAFDAIAGRSWGAIYDDWQVDRAALMAGATTDQLHVTDQWLEDRALLLERKSRFNASRRDDESLLEAAMDVEGRGCQSAQPDDDDC
jgi:hypothetical protein